MAPRSSCPLQFRQVGTYAALILKTTRGKTCKKCCRKFCPHILGICLLLAEELRRSRALYVNETHAAQVRLRFAAFNGYLEDGDEEKFHEYTRFKFNEFRQLFLRLQGRLEHMKSHRYPIEPMHRLVICLRYLAHGRSFHSLAHEFRLGRSTVTKIVYEVCQAIIDEYWEEAFPTPTSETWKHSAEGFESLWNYPRGIGALDGKHFRCIAPALSGSSHFNWKGTFSIVLLILVDSHYRIIMLDCGGKGSVSDSGLFRTSPIRQSLERSRVNFPPPTPLSHFGRVDYHVLADGGFPQHSWLQRPYLQSEAFRERRKIHFNMCFSSARRVVESVFGILTSRFRVFQAPLCGSLENMKRIIVTACVLHNLLAKSISGQEMLSRYPVVDVLNEERNTRQSRTRVHQEAHLQRERLTNYFAERDGC